MSLMPYLVGELLDNSWTRPYYSRDLFLDPRPLHALAKLEREIPRLRSQLRSLSGAGDSLPTILTDKNGFQVNLDVQQFKPEELKVKVDPDNYLVVEAKHEERGDEHGFISREFRRRYKLPENVDLQALSSKLSSDGVLSLHAPLKSIAGSARDIPITHTNAPAVQAAPSQHLKAKAQESMETK